ncbi:hypothetical protein BDV06DRAFT_218770 [Aspergillus oleicola]
MVCPLLNRYIPSLQVPHLPTVQDQFHLALQNHPVVNGDGSMHGTGNTRPYIHDATYRARRYNQPGVGIQVTLVGREVLAVGEVRGEAVGGIAEREKGPRNRDPRRLLWTVVEKIAEPLSSWVVITRVISGSAREIAVEADPEGDDASTGGL